MLAYEQLFRSRLKDFKICEFSLKSGHNSLGNESDRSNKEFKSKAGSKVGENNCTSSAFEILANGTLSIVSVMN
jgi:hypothetical protein